MTELRTGRLRLRRPVPSDVDVILEVHRDPRACRHNPSDALATRAEAEELYARWDDHWRRNGFGYWVVDRTDDRADDTLGFCGVKLVPFHERTVLNLFYRFHPAHWGNGYATEAVRAVAGWAVGQPYPLVARVRPENTASARVAAGAGLVRVPRLDGSGYDGHDLVYAARW